MDNKSEISLGSRRLILVQFQRTGRFDWYEGFLGYQIGLVGVSDGFEGSEGAISASSGRQKPGAVRSRAIESFNCHRYGPYEVVTDGFSSGQGLMFELHGLRRSKRQTFRDGFLGGQSLM